MEGEDYGARPVTGRPMQDQRITFCLLFVIIGSFLLGHNPRDLAPKMHHEAPPPFTNPPLPPPEVQPPGGVDCRLKLISVTMD